MKYNKSEIMKAAWNLVKTAGMTISAALKAAWASAKAPVEMIGEMKASVVRKLTEMGASRWTKGAYDRLYLNNAAFQMIGLEIADSYKSSGRIASAILNGEKISNTRATEITSSLKGIYIDITTGKLSFYRTAKEQHIAMVREALDALTANN